MIILLLNNIVYLDSNGRVSSTGESKGQSNVMQGAGRSLLIGFGLLDEIESQLP